MEQRLSKLVDSVMRLADVRNLDEGNPVIIALKSELGHDTIVIVSYFEPWMGRYPFNVSWVDANPMSANYKQVFKRQSKNPNSTANTKHTWEQLYYYRDVFEPEQYYEDGEFNQLEEFAKHLESHSNPHSVTAEQIKALPLKGGELEGTLVLFSDPVSAKEAATKSYVDAAKSALDSSFQTLNNEQTSILTRLDSIENLTIPNLLSKDASFTNSLTAFGVRLDALEEANSNINLAPIIADIAALKQVDTDTQSTINGIQTHLSNTDNTVSDIDGRLRQTSSTLTSSLELIQANSDSIRAIELRDTQIQQSVSSLDSRLQTIEQYEQQENATFLEIESRLDSLDQQSSTASAKNSAQDVEIETIKTKLLALDGVNTDYDLRIGALETKSASLTTNLQSLQLTVADVNSRLSATEENVTTLNSNVTTLNSDVSSLKDRVASLEAIDISAIDSRIAALEADETSEDQTLALHTSQIASLSTQLAADEQTLIDLTTRLQANTASDALLEKRVADLEANVATDTELATIKSDIDALKLVDSQYSTKFDTIETKLSAIETDENAEQLVFANIESRLRSLESVPVVDYSTQINSLISTDTLLQGGLDSLTLRVTTLENTTPDNIDTTLTNLESRVVALESDETTEHNQLISFNERITTLESKNTAGETTLSEFAARLAALEALPLETVETTLTDFEARILALENDEPVEDSAIAALADRITAIENDEASDDAKVIALADRIASLENTDITELFRIGSLEPRVTTLETEEADLEARVVKLESYKQVTQETFVVTPLKHVHIQETPAYIWNVSHGLNCKDILVSVIVNDEIVIPDTIKTLDENNLMIEFNIQVAGRVVTHA